MDIYNFLCIQKEYIQCIYTQMATVEFILVWKKWRGVKKVKKNKKNNVITVRFDDEKYVAIVKKSEDMGISISAIINILVSEYLKSNEQLNKK